MCETIKARFRPAPLLGAIVFGLGAAPLWCAELPKIIQGSWCTTKTYITSNVQALSKVQAKEFVGIKLRFADAEFQSGERKLQSPKYEQERFKSSELVERFMILPNEIGVTTASITEVTVKDTSGHLPEVPGQTVLIKSPTRIVWYWKGVFFEAARCREK